MPYPKTNLEKDVLDWCNRIRKALGKKPRKTLPKGEQNSTTCCPIANATGLCVDYKSVECDTLSDAKKLLNKTRLKSTSPEPTMFFDVPKYVDEFLKKFDRGDIPHLIQDRD